MEGPPPKEAALERPGPASGGDPGPSPHAVRASGGDSGPRPHAVPPWLEVGAAWGVRLLVLAAMSALVLYLISRLLLVVLPVLVGLMLTTVLHGPMRRLCRRGLPQGVASLLIVALVVLLGAAAIALVGAPTAARAGEFAQTVQSGLGQAADAIARSPLGVTREELVAGINGAGRRLLQGGVAGSVASGLGTAASFLGALLLTVVVLFFFLRDGRRMWQAVLEATSERRRPVLERSGNRAWATLRAYVLGVTTVAAIDAVLIGIALLVAGVPLVLPLAVLTFVAAYLPVIGAVISGAVAVLVALVTGGIWDAVFIAAAVLVIQQLEGNVLYPRIMSERMSLHPLTTILAVAVGSTLAGVIGAFVSVPLAAVVAGGVGDIRGSADPEAPESPDGSAASEGP